jgi:TetR/AcrR family transcriptional regulator
MADGIHGTRERILREALDLFASKGYDATSVREICAAAGLTKPTLYHFFGSKEGLYRALVDASLDQFRADLAQVLGRPGTTEERLRRLARGYLETARREAQLMRLIFALLHARPSAAPPTDFARFSADVSAAVARVIDEGVAHGELAPGRTDLRVLVLLGSLGEALTGYLLFGHPDLTPGLADALTDTILDGWRH